MQAVANPANHNRANEASRFYFIAGSGGRGFGFSVLTG